MIRRKKKKKKEEIEKELTFGAKKGSDARDHEI